MFDADSDRYFLSLFVALAAMTSAMIVPPQCFVTTTLVGDGDPSQTYLHMQVSDNLQCASHEGCSVSHLTSHTVGYTVSAGIAEWISGGFSVEESVTTGNTYTCDGNPNDEICVWATIPHTAYTVHDINEHCGGPQDSRILKSPNTDWDTPTGYYCVVGTCRSEGQMYWDDKPSPHS